MTVSTNFSRKLQGVMTYFCYITMVAICCCFLRAIPAQAQDSNFFNERYRGWLWFEEDRKKLPKQQQVQYQDHVQEQDEDAITPESAKEEIEQLAKELDDTKYVMLARPSPQNIKAYMEKEAIVWKNIERLQKAWEIANFLYPEHHDLIKEPVNVHAIKLKHEMADLRQSELIKDFAGEFDLVLFFKGACKFCSSFEPVLKNFGERFGFKVEAVTMDGTKSEHFVTANLPRLAKQLGIEAVPTLVAVSKDGKIAFELVRGFLSLTELEEHSARAAGYLVSKGILQEASETENNLMNNVSKRKHNNKVKVKVKGGGRGRGRSKEAISVDPLTHDKIKQLKR